MSLPAQRRPRSNSEQEVEALTEATMIEAANDIARATPARRIRWMMDGHRNERWAYEGEPIPKGWRHLLFQDER